MNKKYNIAFIIPRYLCGGAGGAEVHCQDIAENLTKRGHQITVLTTTAKDPHTWTNDFKATEENINGVQIKRFKINPDRNVAKFLAIQNKIDLKLELSENEEKEWIENSVRSSAMENFIKNNKQTYDGFIFMPYLFGTTYNTYTLCADKNLLIPCLHDENFAYLKIFKKMFTNMQGILFNTIPEMLLGKKIYNLVEEKIEVVGTGLEIKRSPNPKNFTKKYSIDFPYLLFIGRREAGKNIPLLLSYFKTYKLHNHNKLKLLFFGSGELPLKPRDKEHIIDLGFVSQEDKQDGTAAATALCQPSVNESLSLVTMEAWLNKIPVLVHAKCEVTKYHCLQSNGGLFFRNYYQFEECLNYLLTHSRERELMGENGKKYIANNYNWNTIMNKFEKALNKFLN